MRMAWTKAVADLREQFSRTVLLWLAIAVGTMVVMAALGSRVVLEREITASFFGSCPAAVIVWTDVADGSLMDHLRSIDGVAAVDSRRLVRARVRVRDGEWRSLLLYGVRDFDDIAVSRVYPVEGKWPPTSPSVLIEQSAIPVVGAKVGQTITVRVPGAPGNQQVVVSGIAHDPAQAPGWQDNLGYAYTTSDTLALLGLGSQLDEIFIAVSGDRRSAEHVAGRAHATIRALERPIYRVEVPPRKHPHADHMQAMLLLLQVLAVLSLLISALIAANLFASLLSRQTRQVGVMKTLGGRPWMIVRIYLLLSALVSVSAAFFGTLGGVFLARWFSAFAGRLLNLYEQSSTLPGWTVTAVLLSSSLVPIGASLVPILRAARMSIREAIQDVGIRWAESSRGSAVFEDAVPVSWRLALRNSLRRRGRFALTVGSFAVGGAMLMTAANVHKSLVGAVDASLDSRQDEIEIRLLEPAPTDELTAAFLRLDEVERVEPWGAALAGFTLPRTTATPDGIVAGRYVLLAPPDGVLQPRARLVKGRRPSPGADRVEVVLNRQLLALEPHLSVGSETMIYIRERATHAAIVGVSEEIAPASAYVTPEGMRRALGRADVSGGARLVLSENADPLHVTSELERILATRDWFPVYLMTKAELRAAMLDHFMILLFVLLALATAAILVGVLGLATTLSINVLERQREIGVTKAIGAGARSILLLVFAEGVATTSASLPLAFLLSVPLSALVNSVVGSHGLHVALPYQTSLEATLGWCVLATIATAIACLGPAGQAVRRPVRQLVAYE